MAQRQVRARLTEAASAEGLRAALLRLTGTRFEALERDLAALQARLDALASLQDTLMALEGQLDDQAGELGSLLHEAQAQIKEIQVQVDCLDDSLHTTARSLRADLEHWQAEMEAPEAVQRRIAPVLIRTVDDRARQEKAAFGRAIAPVIGPALRRQIREARQDVIDAIYPVIGEIISKALSESIRELTRSIDARLRRQLAFKSRMRGWYAQLQGVSEAEMLLRDALPYAVDHIFLIHRPTGLLLSHIPVSGESSAEMDIVSGMLTAIRDFVSDSFGEAGELEEITHGDQRFLLEGGQHAYLAVVLTGVEPGGYSQLIKQVVHQINLEHEEVLAGFQGEMDALPDFRPLLEPLIQPEQETLLAASTPPAMSRRQRMVSLGVVAAGVLLLALAALACLYAIRLGPLVFP